MNWKHIRLDEFVKFQRGFDLPREFFCEGTVPVYGSTSILGYHNEAKVKAPGVITGRSGTLGVFQFATEDFWAHNTTLWVKDFKGNDPKFAYYLMQCLDFGLFNSGGAVPTLNRNVLRSFKIDAPPLPTQLKIASILSVYDDLINNNLKRINLLEEFSQLSFNNLFSKINGLPKGWEEKYLCELVGHEIGGGWGEEFQNREFSEAAYVIRGTDIDELPHGKLHRVPFRYHKKSNLSSRKLQDGDIVFEVSGGSQNEGVAKTLLITDELLKQFNSDVMCASFCKLLRPKSRQLSNFTFLFLRFLREVRATEVFEIRSASNIVNYNWTAFLKFQKVKVPDEKTLEQFNEIIDPIYKQIYNLGHQNRLLKEARDILLPRLMTGIIEVKAKETKVVSIAPIKEVKVSQQFKEAVLISMLADKFGTEEFPLGRKHYTKYSYFFHRKVQDDLNRYSRLAAGMYDPSTKYGGPEKIALQNGYVKNQKASYKGFSYSGFIAGNNIGYAREKFINYWNMEQLDWLNQFKRVPTDMMGLYTTVDNAMIELNKVGKSVSVDAIKEILKKEKEWKQKLQQPIFSDINIQKAINYLPTLFQYS